MVKTVTDLELAKKQLYDGTISVYEFDQMYGEGAANDIINGTYRTPDQIAAAEAETQANQGMLQQASAVAGDVLQGIANGVEEAINETAQTVNSVGENLEERLGVGRLVWEDSDGDGKTDWVPSYWSREKVVENRDQLAQDAITNFAENQIEFIDAPEGTAGNVAQGISQFVTGFYALGGAKSFVGAMLKGGIVDATVFDPYEANLSAFLEENGWAQNAVTEALATDVNAPEWENRLRNSLEGGIAGLALEGVIRSVKFAALGRKANTEIKQLGEVTDETAAQLDEVHAEAADIEESIATNKDDALVAEPDGSFEAPDGTVYRPDGDMLAEVQTEAPAQPRTPDELYANAVDAVLDTESASASTIQRKLKISFNEAARLVERMEAEGVVSPANHVGIRKILRTDRPVRPEAPKASEAAPEALPEAIARPEVEAEAPAQPETPIVEVEVAPKIELIDRDKFDAALTRARDMNDFELRSMEEGAFLNFENMTGPVEGAKVIDALQDVISKSDGFKKMGADKPETQQEVVAKALQYTAENTGTDVNRLIRDLNVRETVSRDMASRIVAGKMALQSTGKRISDLADKIEMLSNTGKATEEIDRQLVDAMQMHVELQANVKGLQTAAARATAAGRIATDDALKVDSLDRLAVFGGSERVRMLAKQLRSIDDEAKRSKYVKKAVERKWLRVLNEYWINSILSGYTTHALNMTSNTINLLARPAERAIGAAVRLDGKETTKALKTYVYMATYMKDALTMAAKSGWNHRAIIDNSAKIDSMQGQRTTRALSGEALGIQNKAASTVVDLLGKATTLPSRALGTEDEFFKQLAFRSNLRSNIVVDASRMSIGDLNKMGYNSRQEFIDAEFEKAFETKISAEERWQEMVLMGKVADDPKVKEKFINETLGAANQRSAYAMKALDEARQTTFTNPLQRGTMSHGFQEYANRHPVLRQIVPFIQTPMNIMTNAWDRTPVLNLYREEYNEALRSPDPAIRSQAVGKMVLGTAIYSSLTYLAIEGRITGGGPTDPKLAALYRNSKNWQPYSINVGTPDNPKWISYQRMDPWTTAFGIVGDISEMIEMGQMADADASSYISMTVAALGNNIVSKTYLQGIADVVNIMNAKDTPWEIDGFFKRRAGSMLPFSSFTGQLNNAFDDNLREVRTVLDQFRKQSGIGRSSLPLKYDWISGQPLETPEKMLGYIQVKSMKPEDKDIALINSEMQKLNYRFTGGERKIGGITLTPEQYQRWNQLVGTTKVSGRTLSEALVREINKDRYRKDDDDYNLVLSRDSHRVQMLNRQISRYRDRAKRLLYKEFPELQQRVREYDRYSDKAKRGNIGEMPVLDMNLE